MKLFIPGELARLGGLVHLGEMILSIFYNRQQRKDVRNKLRQKFGSFMQKKCSYIIQLTSDI